MKKLEKKLQSSSGETLAETLVASLIAALAMLLLASMVMNATHIVEKGETTMEKFYKGLSEVETYNAGIDEAGKTEEGNAQVSEANLGIEVYDMNSNGGIAAGKDFEIKNISIPIEIYKDDTWVSYKVK